MGQETKIFVLDTNVILHDYNSIHNFDDNDVVIPITVLEELDKFKKGNDTVNFNARSFMRELDKVAGKALFNEGVSLGEGKGLLFIETGKKFSEIMQESFSEDIPDHRILSVAEFLHYKFHDRKVVLISQDINLRMKAKAIGVKAEDYETGKVKDVEKLYKNVNEVKIEQTDIINKIYQSKTGVDIADLDAYYKSNTNEYFILKDGHSSILLYNNPFEKRIEKVDKVSAYGIRPKNSEQTFAMHALLNPDIKLVALTGKAGTGKTLLALAAALQQRHIFNQIFLARPLVALSDKDMGFLPGTAKEKINPFMQPLFDNLSVIKNQFSQQSKDYARIEDMQKEEKLMITPLAYIRGRSLTNIFFIVDEAQNLTPHEIKTIITRAGEGVKLVFTGDIYQIDSPYLDAKSNGLSYLSDRMQNQKIFAHINLMKGERSALADIASELL